MKALGIEAHHVILAIAPDGAGIIRNNIGPDGLGEMSALLKEIAEQAAAPYIVTNAPIIREQLQKAGVRLAHLLDAALGK